MATDLPTSRSMVGEDPYLRAFVVAVAGSALLFIATFLPFLTASAGGLTTAFTNVTYSQSWNLWTDNSGIVLTGLALASVVLARARLYLALFATSVPAVLDVLYERSTVMSAQRSLLGAFVQLDVSWAFWAALVAAALIFSSAVIGKAAGK